MNQNITRILLFVSLISFSWCAQSATDRARPDIMNNDGLSDAMFEVLQKQQAQSGRGIWYPKKLCFTQDTFNVAVIGDDELLAKYKSDADTFTLTLPARHQLKSRSGAAYAVWIRAHLCAAARDAGKSVKSYEKSKEWKRVQDDLILRGSQRHAMQDGYDHCLRVTCKRCHELGIDNDEIILGVINQKMIEKQQEDIGEQMLEDVDSLRINYQAEVDPSGSRKVLSVADKHALSPWRRFYRRNQDTIDSISRGLLIFSAAAFIFNKLGGTEWLKNKIREMFDKPTVYEVRRRKKGWFGKGSSDDLVREEDLLLAPGVRKQVSELIYLIRRRYEMRKKTNKRFALPLLLLYGPPGTGKTTIAQLIADQTIGDNGQPMNFIKLVASDFMQVRNEGDRVAVLKKMFRQARSMGNTVIFLDEIDGMVRQRGQGDELVNRAFLDHLLDEIAKPSPDFMVIAATNHINRIDDALLSRFRRKIEIKLPALRQRVAIMSRYAQQMLLKHRYSISFDSHHVAELMQGASGRDIETFFMRIRDRLDFMQENEATVLIADQILREMGVLPPLPEEADLDDVAVY